MRMTLSIVVTGCVLCSLLVPVPSFPAESTSSVPSTASPVSSVLVRDKFILIGKRNTFLLQFTSGGAKRQSKIPRHWLIPAKAERDEQNNYVSSFKYHKEITSFPIGNGQIGLHLSSFESMKDGSAQAAAGRDVFLVYDPYSAVVQEGLTALSVTKERMRSAGCLSAQSANFLLADVNQDGFQDIGVVQEFIQCKDRSHAQEAVYEQKPVQWYVFRAGQWKLDLTYSGAILKDYTELPLIGMVVTPVDYVGYRRWRSYDPSIWGSRTNNPLPYQPEYRKKLIENDLKPKRSR